MGAHTGHALFFKLSKYQDSLLKKLEEDKVHSVVLLSFFFLYRFLERDFEDFVTRKKERTLIVKSTGFARKRMLNTVCEILSTAC